MKKYQKQVLSFLCFLTCFIIMIVILPSICFAKKDESKVVRVGYTIAPGYQEGGDGEYKTGYGYAYLQEIARINSWKYEYVYGTFQELLEKLENGEVDIMGNLSYSEERAKKISYGINEQGNENYYLYVNKNTNSIDATDYSTIKGKKIGVCAGEIVKDSWLKWCNEHKIDCVIVEYKSMEECKDALNSGKIDAMAEGHVAIDKDTKSWQALLKFDSSSFYFGINKKRADLLSELNYAQNEILSSNPFYNEKIQERYLELVSMLSINLSDNEKTWLDSHKHHIRFGYLLGFAPLCYQDENGTFKGIAADVISVMEERYADENIEFEPVSYEDYYTMFDDLRSGKIDVAWPAYDDFWNAEKSEFSVTDKIIDTQMLLVYDGKYTDDTIKKIGVINTGSLPKVYGTIYYPKSKIIEYDSYEDAIHAILTKEVSSVLYVSTTYNMDTFKNRELERLNVTILPDSFGISCAVSPENGELISILNKGISALGEAGVNQSLITNSSIERDLTLKTYLEYHPYYAIAFIVIMIVIAAGIVIFVIYKNMSVRVKISQSENIVLEKLSKSDPLTGLYNRKAVFQKCKELLKAHPEENFVMLHVDMKRFRLFNTFFGEETGDQLLCDIADFFRSIDKDYEYWAYGRIEADVFCAFFPYERKKYQKHITMCLQYLNNYREDFLIEPTMGMYFVKDLNMSIESMFVRATMAAKEVQPTTPYATVVYDEKLEKKLNESQEVINDMQRAIDEEQFQVYLQPKYSLRTNKPIGAEALVRWQHPTKGMISPGIFIPVFERNGFITLLDHYMWEHVCKLLRKWKDEGKTLFPISVNMSRLSMYSEATVEFLKKLVKKYDIEPQYLELELTESAYMDEPEEMKKLLNMLRTAGFTILLDDFGSGYSSLNTLRELPVDVLKLDMKFLSLKSNDIQAGIVLSSIVRMSQLLKLRVIAEGVEKQEQADFLKGIGCGFVQGFLFARPMPVADYEKIIMDCEKPLKHVNQPMIDHIRKIIAETGTVTYAMGTVLPLPLAYTEYSNGKFAFLRVNPKFYEEFNLEKELETASCIFKKHLTKESYAQLTKTMENIGKTDKVSQVLIIWNLEDGQQKKYMCSLTYEGNIGDTIGIVITFTNITPLSLTDGQIIH